MVRTVNDLKSSLGERLGVRKNKYLLELFIPVSNYDPAPASKIDILCQSASFPEINNTTLTTYHKGRRFQTRGETDYGSDYVITFIDDDRMSLRRLFQSWMILIDNTTPKSHPNLLENDGFSGWDIFGSINSAGQVWNDIQNTLSSDQMGFDFVRGLFDSSVARSTPSYMTDFNVWQLAGNTTGHNGDVDSAKIMGYKIQSAFPKSISAIDYSDEIQNENVRFSVTFGFSEVTPMHSMFHNTVDSIVNILS